MHIMAVIPIVGLIHRQCGFPATEVQGQELKIDVLWLILPPAFISEQQGEHISLGIEPIVSSPTHSRKGID